MIEDEGPRMKDKAGGALGLCLGQTAYTLPLIFHLTSLNSFAQAGRVARARWIVEKARA